MPDVIEAPVDIEGGSDVEKPDLLGTVDKMLADIDTVEAEVGAKQEGEDVNVRRNVAGIMRGDTLSEKARLVSDIKNKLTELRQLCAEQYGEPAGGDIEVPEE